ncbi:Short-chain dehydrogenase/reductase family Oxidoreductase [Colletotrichum higginsianum IMI 349063]|uniref:Short-chain dehydrogenase/reductase family Oxidoreductase n=1 Tax=Colletotrichum higginsianum (strain IMI 349063) TaxID=759273 RepID=A0A1B7YGX6_COLHI|nr:Short-chain dehydrogenase/reductase family Oxidoreductase [Colletotrichum higginsianum IMI 349063]OBR11411.1 Short-chain dehydrogenase/reductase family Oxidoreductase [Colletotrichum higginsianum IMI 349063]
MTPQWNPLSEMPDLRGKVAVVTGGNSDIGREVVRLLAWKGAKVYFTTRSEAKALEARKRIQDAYPDIEPDNLQCMTLDVADLRSITSVADKLMEKERKVDVLIHAAAAGTTSTDLVGPGWEVHMATNLIGPFVFTNRLLPLLKNAVREPGSDVRVVTMSSSAQTAMVPSSYKFRFTTADFLRNPVPSPPWQWRYLGRFIFGFDTTRYGVSKAANAVFAQELQRRLDEQKLPIVSLAVHPGEVATAGVDRINTALVRAISHLTFVSPEQGAATPVFAAVAKEVRQDPLKYNGKFVFPVGALGQPHAVASDEKQVQGLWQNTTAEVNKHLQAEGLPLLSPW